MHYSIFLQSPHSLIIKTFCNNYLNIRAEETMQSLTTMYGPATCHLLTLHERKGSDDEPPGPNPWRQVSRHVQITDVQCTQIHSYIMATSIM